MAFAFIPGFDGGEASPYLMRSHNISIAACPLFRPGGTSFLFTAMQRRSVIPALRIFLEPFLSRLKGQEFCILSSAPGRGVYNGFISVRSGAASIEAIGLSHPVDDKAARINGPYCFRDGIFPWPWSQAPFARISWASGFFAYRIGAPLSDWPVLFIDLLPLYLRKRRNYESVPNRT